MGSVGFRDRAIHEGLRYGEDSLVFLREFCQNSRDAGAERIGISTRYTQGEMVVTFTDDGVGMDFKHAQKFLFTLYASSKEKENASAGHFGVGFWSVLLFKPSRITIASKTKKNGGWQAVLEGDLAGSHTGPPSPGLGKEGTRIEVRKQIPSRGEFEHVQSRIKGALKKYCRYLRKKNHSSVPLPIELDGNMINEDFALEGDCSMGFRHGSIEGAVGLGQRPRVEVYARGLLVWHGTVLDELKYAANRVKTPPCPEGLSPIFVLNGSELSVTLDRRAVIDDGQLARLRFVATQKMRTLLNHYLRGVERESLFGRLSNAAADLADEIRLNRGVAGLVALVAVLIIMIGVGALATRWNGTPQPGDNLGPRLPAQFPLIPRGPPTREPLGNFRPFDGPAIDPIAQEIQIPLVYSPPLPLLFRTQTFETLSGGRGVTGTSSTWVAAPKPPPCIDDAPIEVSVDIAVNPGYLVVPVPTGYNVKKDSILLSGQRVSRVGTSRTEDSVIQFKQKTAGLLTYKVCKTNLSLTRRRRSVLLNIPKGIALPPALLHKIAPGPPGHVSQIVEQVRTFLKNRVAYDRSRSAAKGYARFLRQNQRSGWFTFVLSYGRGDCDVVNTVFVALLRKLGVPARLAIGLVGKGGKVQAGRHAWVEYYDKQWRVADATERVAEPTERVAEPTDRVAEPTDRVTEPTDRVTDDALLVAQGTPAEGTTAEPSDIPGDENRHPHKSLGAFVREWISKLPFTTIAQVATVVAFLAAAFSVFLILLSNRSQNAFRAHDGTDMNRVAAEILTNALEQPTVWKGRGNLTSRKLLPRLGTRKRLSLEQALSRARAGALWHSTGESSLAKKVKKNTSFVLDSSAGPFEKLIRSIPGIQDLDNTSELHPIHSRTLWNTMPEAGSLIDEMNQVIAGAGLPASLILPCSGLQLLCRDVDLRTVGSSARLGMPSQFVGVGHLLPEFQKWCAVQGLQPGFGVFCALDHLTASSNILRPHRRPILRTAAGKMFEVSG